MDHPSNTKRQKWVIEQLHHLEFIEQLSSFDEEQGLKEALKLQELAARNIAPYSVLMNATNKLVSKLKGE